MRNPRLCTLLPAVLAFLTLTASAADGIPMPKFLEMQPQWETLAAAGTPLTIDGRIASAGSKLLRLQKCPLLFRPQDETLNLPPRDTVRVAVAGHLQQQAGGLIFLVGELRALPSDSQAYLLREAASDQNDPADWYRLADWCVKTGTFYDDAFLLDKAAAARRRGLRLERDAAGDAIALQKLADKAAGFAMPDLATELRHRALWLRWTALQEAAQTNPLADFTPLLQAILRELPGADTPVIPLPADTAARYAAKPLGVYEETPTKQRSTLHRLFYLAVKQTAIERDADPTGANGDAIAMRLEATLPERADLADRYRLRAMNVRLSHVGTATRDEALTLAQRFRDRGDDAKAADALAAWLAAREASLRPEGVSGLVRAAEDYVAVAGDTKAAVRLLREADALSPASELVGEAFAALGYVRRGEAWLSPEAAAARPPDPVLVAMREGRITPGMSPEQVRRTLGSPDRVARSAAVSQVYEVWLYGTPGRSGVAVHFVRYKQRPPEEARAVAIRTLGP